MADDPDRTARPDGIDQPDRIARIAGVAYVLTIVFGISAQVFGRAGIIVRGDAGATAQNLVSAEHGFRLAIVSDLAMLSAYIVVTVLFWALFRPVGRIASAVAAGFSAAGIAVGSANLVRALSAPLLLSAPSGLDPGIAASQAYLALVTFGQGYGLSIVFFGVYCVLIGVLCLRSAFVAGWVGALMAFAGACYLVDSLTMVLGGSLPAAIDRYMLLPGLLGEGALSLWLLVKGVARADWRARDAIAAADMR